MINYKNALNVFENYVLESRTISLDNNVISGIDLKYNHSLNVVNEGSKVIKNLKFNSSFTELTKICLLNHDIGRFEQVISTGNFNDYELFLKLGFKNHGELGSKVLENGILDLEIQKTRIFDYAIKKVINDHVTGVNDIKQLQILKNNILTREDAYDIFKCKDEKIKSDIISSITQIVQDVDRLDILYSVLDNKIKINYQNFDIDPIVLDMFYKGKYLNINELKEKHLWNSSVGELVRLSFINEIKLYSIAKTILDENIIIRLKEKSYIKHVYDYTNYLLKEMINNSDGVIVEKVKKI